MSLYRIDTRGELHPFLDYEWLLTNGMGAFAASSLVGCNTRRYHGLLCAATLPPVGRVMALNRIGELLRLGGNQELVELSINQFGRTFHPRGERYLRHFELGNIVAWEYVVEDVHILKQVLLVQGKNVVAVRYQVESESPRNIELQLLPFVSLRDFHSLRRQPVGQLQAGPVDHCQLTVSDGPNTLTLRSDSGQVQSRGDWWYGHNYAVETERGLDDAEDLFVPAAMIHRFEKHGAITLWASMEKDNLADYDWDAELTRKEQASVAWSISNPANSNLSPVRQRLLRAANDFVVARRRPDSTPGTTILAGYPWFADWGRDTMISLPGLLLTTGRFKEAGQVLALFAEYVSEGMIPNRFDDYTNEPSYNTVDASLWFIHAAFEYLRLSHDQATFDARLLPACTEIVRGFRQGTRFHIRMDEADGLISAGDPGTQLTWMDAKCDGVVFTPRHGKAVEINALWYNALVLLGDKELAERVRQSFRKTFWQNPFRGLFDVVTGAHRDGAIRPNQIFAVSLPNSPLDAPEQLAVVEVVRRELLTPYGLRTLAKSDPGYKGHYRGGPMQRDGAYHNGTVWTWLIGPFLEAYIKVHHRDADSMRQARVWLQPLLDNLNQACVGQISECFEGDEPHRPVGCPAQAWSVAEVLRLAVELEM